MRNLPKITPADYPGLLAEVDAGTPQRELARRYGCAPSLVARHVARAKQAQRLSLPARECNPSVTSSPHTGSTREILEARVRDPKTSARDLASLVNALAKVDGVETASDDALRTRLLMAKQRIRELEAAQFRLPRFMPGVNDWFDALPVDVEDWTQLPDAPIELVDPCGDAHHVLAEDASFFVDQLGWTPPRVYEPEDSLIEEWRAKIADFDACHLTQPENEDRAPA